MCFSSLHEQLHCVRLLNSNWKIVSKARPADRKWTFAEHRRIERRVNVESRARGWTEAPSWWNFDAVVGDVSWRSLNDEFAGNARKQTRHCLQCAYTVVSQRTCVRTSTYARTRWEYFVLNSVLNNQIHEDNPHSGHISWNKHFKTKLIEK